MKCGFLAVKLLMVFMRQIYNLLDKFPLFFYSFIYPFISTDSILWPYSPEGRTQAPTAAEVRIEMTDCILNPTDIGVDTGCGEDSPYFLEPPFPPSVLPASLFSHWLLQGMFQDGEQGKVPVNISFPCLFHF